MSAGDVPAVELIYTRRNWVLGRGESVPRRGGYYARIAGFSDQGAGGTVEAAVEDLAWHLREHVEHWDAEADDYRSPRASMNRLDRHQEPALVAWARHELRA